MATARFIELEQNEISLLHNKYFYEDFITTHYREGVDGFRKTVKRAHLGFSEKQQEISLRELQ
jgi:hypothetical protein